jgi:hypothetical protein
MVRHRSRALGVLSLPILLVGVALCGTSSASAQTPKGKPQPGKHVNIVSPRCPIIDCHLGTWTALTATKLRATHDAASAVVAELVRGAQVEGIAARTVTTYLPLCKFVRDSEGRRAGCVEPDCKPVKFHPGDEFFLRERLGAALTLIESRDGEFEIGDSLSQVQHPSGKIEFVRGYQCDGELEAGIWVQVRLPDGTTGWSYRESFDGTIDWSAGGVVGGGRWAARGTDAPNGG